MLEIQCVLSVQAAAEYVQQVLAADAELTWLVEANEGGNLYGVRAAKILDDMFFWARAVKLVPAAASVVNIAIWRRSWPPVGNIRIVALPVGCAVMASNVSYGKEAKLYGAEVWYFEDDTGPILPVWEKVVAALDQFNRPAGGPAPEPVKAGTPKQKRGRRRDWMFGAFEKRLEAACGKIWLQGKGDYPTKDKVCKQDNQLAPSKIDDYLGDEGLTWSKWLDIWLQKQNSG